MMTVARPRSAADHPAPRAMRRARLRSLLALTVPALVLALLPAGALADTSSTLTVVGTSDVSDSGLIQNVIEPAFHAAYPQYTFKYIGTGTGAAITSAKSGSQGASVLIVHAPSLENQFVSGGYSYNHQYGYSLFTNDFVLAGPTQDPAGVAAGAPHNIAQAFAEVATAGIEGKAQFISRGGTPGTTVEEHAIWQLVDGSGLAPQGLLLCAVNATNGGGETPIAAGNGVTANGQPCPNGGALPSGSQLPSWYTVTGLTQGPNVLAANTCNGYSSGPNSCYVLTDRGTFDYLISGQDPAGSVNNLTIVTRQNSADAPGGAAALINYFHGYVINPSMPGESVNLAAAQDFLNLVTSPALQARLVVYLNSASDPGGAPFVPAASPLITVSSFPAKVDAGAKVTLTGTVTNAEPFFPAIGHARVNVDEIEAGIPVPVAHGATSLTGTFSISFKPAASAQYEVSTGQISQIENASLSPAFGDILSPAASAPAALTVIGLATSHRISLSRTKVHGRTVTVTGSLSPAPALGGTTIRLLALPSTSTGGLRTVGHTTLRAGRTEFSVRAKLSGAGRWILQLEYLQKGQTPTYSKLGTVLVR